MEQSYQAGAVQEIQGKSVQTTDAEILAAVRAILTAEEVSHPEVEREHQEAASRSRIWASAPKPQRNAAANAAVKPSLVTQIFGRLRG